MGHIKITILILTKNRENTLAQNLDSLKTQIVKPQTIVIVDNSTNKKTKKLIESYKDVLPIKYYHTRISGYSRLYNFGLLKCEDDLICFLDDDCMAKKDWLKYLSNASTKFPNSLIQGNSFSIPQNNIYAQITGDHYQNWIKSNLIGDLELKVCDNKNLAAPKKIINRYGNFSQRQNVGSEDLEFGIRLRNKGIKIIFESRAIVWHNERSNLQDFVKQHIRIAKSEAICDINTSRFHKIGIFPNRKSYLNFVSAVEREWVYLINFDLVNFLLLPIIYTILFFVRIFFYISTVVEKNIFLK